MARVHIVERQTPCHFWLGVDSLREYEVVGSVGVNSGRIAQMNYTSEVNALRSV